MNKLISNYFFNALYQFLLLALPLISTPYVARVLNPTGVGISSYTTSVIQVFMFFAMLGIQLYGNRQIASVSHKGQQELSKEFLSIYLIQFFSAIITIVIYLLFVNYYIDSNKFIFYIQSIALIGVLLDISWLFIGMEELKKVVLRNAFVKVISLALIFILVKEPSDLYIYILINVLTSAIGQGIMWFQVPKYIMLIPFSSKRVINHLKPMIMIFLPLIFVQIYTVYNKVILGVVLTATDVGFYDQSLKIIQIVVTVVTSLGLVMLPRISSEYAKGNIHNISSYVEKALRFVLFITMPMCIGLIAISSKLVPWFLGAGYSEVIFLLKVMSPIIVFIGCANVFGIQILIPIQQQNKYTLSVAIAAILSLIINISLVAFLGNTGTAIALVVAEGVGVLIQAIFVRKIINFKGVWKYFYKYLLASMFMGIIAWKIGEILNSPGILVTLSQVTVSIMTYIFIMIFIKDDFTLDILKKGKVIISSFMKERFKNVF